MNAAAELIWAAGLFEGEGWVSEVCAGRQIYMAMGIEMSDEDVIEQFALIMSRYGIDPSIHSRERGYGKHRKHKTQWSWRTTGTKAVKAYFLLRPYLASRRRAKGDELVEKHEARIEELTAERRCPECGQTFRPDTVYGSNKIYCSVRCMARAKRRRPTIRAAANEANRRYKTRQRIKVSPSQDALF